MSIKKRTTDKETDGFEADLCTLFCDETGEKMLDIIVRDSDKEDAPITQVEALWAYGPSYGSGSGKHEMAGLLSYGPIQTPSQKTEVVDMRVNENEDSSAEIEVYIIKSEEDGG